MVAIGASPPAWQAAMENKRLDAMCVGLPIGEQVQAAGFATPYIMPGLGDAKILAGMPETNIVATSDYIGKNSATVRALSPRCTTRCASSRRIPAPRRR